MFHSDLKHFKLFAALTGPCFDCQWHSLWPAPGIAVLTGEPDRTPATSQTKTI